MIDAPQAAGAPPLRSLHRRNLREDAVEVLRAAILGGDLSPGSIHSAASLAERLGVSPTPVREAMLELASSGLVEVLPNRGFRVTTVDHRDLDEVCQLRMMLELPALALAAERATDADLDRLEEPLRQLETAARKRDVPAFLVADREFHLSLLELSGNHRLVEIIAGLRYQTRIVGLKPLAELDALRSSAAEHRPILEALRAGDLTEAQRLLTAHLDHTRRDWAGVGSQADEPTATA